MSSARSLFQSISKELGVRPDEVVQVVSDGLNEKGLSVTVQWDYDVPGYPNATNSTHALSAIDLSTHILASFGTVEEVRKALDPATYSVVNFQLSPAATTTLRNSGLLSPEGFPLIHLGLHDAAHDSLVIEFEGSTHVLRENPTGVLTNEPQLLQHYSQLERYLNNRMQVPQIQFQRFREGTFKPVHYNSTFYAPPGDHSSQSRFIRLAMLNRVAGLRSWPTDQSWSPDAADHSKGLFVAAETILNTIVLPPAIDDAGGAGSANDDYTQVIILRDHVNLMYYFRSPRTPQWQAINLQKKSTIDRAASKRLLHSSTLRMIPVGHNSQQPWFTDVSASVL
ncbi:probable choloylglycine hydrolase [Coccomyxa sp. Obi]|nr:probable choloylglycine hydrolase [Coccomyxa sp. Obi]